MHNITNNCTVGVEPPTNHLVLADCGIRNFTDPALQRWVTRNKTKLIDFKPQARVETSLSFLYCPLRTILIDGDQYPCPFFPFTIPADSEFRVSGALHEVSSININAIEEDSSINFSSLNESMTNYTIIPNLEDLIQELHEANGESEQLMEGRIIIPLSGPVPYLYMLGMILLWLLSMSLVTCYLK